VQAVVSAAVTAFDCPPAQVFVASTGVIGVPLPAVKARAGVADAASRLASDPADYIDAANAIGTTDTFAKGATASAIVDGERIVINGIVKGSGMIAPDMATMLGFIFTDAAVAPDFLQMALTQATATSFNAITVDSDTSTPTPCWRSPPARPATPK
jgi:glutamate N-acetyltransferase/amino-acid N-acetyltransferase